MGVLADAIRDRLADLGLPAKRISDAGYLPQSTFERVMRGQDSLRSTEMERSLERGLGWVAGSLDGIRAGGQPTEIPIKTWPRRDGDWRAAIEQAWQDHEGQAAVAGGQTVTRALSKEIRIAMIRADVTVSDLIEKTGIRPAVLTSRLEATSDWSVTELLSVARALDLSPIDLIEPLIHLAGH